eukprot:TRINITY_DN1596_c0_g1_i1.p1 TRINITY_DN1596_c0_g1~~TRINITY_DN1596_c0_g1_i1.p1  ORF type:complete len:592 (-),score=120.51 TRINITY_DN1596_c0_g1_i1:41-1795(-)
MAKTPQQALAEKVVGQLCGPQGPFTLGEEVVRGQKYRVFKKGALLLTDLYKIGYGHGAADFLVYQDKRLSFAAVQKLVAAVAHQLQTVYGVKKGERVSIAMRNNPEFILTFMAATTIGAVATPLNAWWVGHELEYGLTDSGTSVLVIDSDRLKRLAPVLGNVAGPGKALRAIITVGTTDAQLSAIETSIPVVPWEKMLASGMGHSPAAVAIDQDDNAVIMYTSGTTGHPKGVVNTHRGIMTAINMLVLTGAIGSAMSAAAGVPQKPSTTQEAILMTVPLFHATATHAIFLPSLFIGRKIVLMYKWDAEAALDLIEKEKITGFTGVPTMVQELIESPSFSRRDVSSLKGVGGGGAPTPPKLVAATKAKFPNGSPSQGYGLTETNAITCLNGGDDYIAHPTSCGRPVLVVDIKVVDENGKQVPTNTAGEILIRGATVMKEYWNKPEATAQAIDKDGWFRSGDIGRIDAEGFVYIMDRAKDIIIRGGENISCAEVEASVYEHPAVMEAAAFGLPHERLGEEVAVAVYVKPGHSLDSGALLRFLSDKIAGFKQPTKVILWEGPLPRGATGKILKREIRDMVAQKKAKL